MTYKEKLLNLKQLIGNTPLIKINYKYKSIYRCAYMKAEWYNLTGSIKDRVAYYILLHAYENGLIKDDTRICEVSSGNMGISFAALGHYLGNSVTICIPKTMSEERIKIIKSYGANVILTNDFKEAFEITNKFEAEGYFIPHQFENEYNALAHYETTAKEIASKLEEVPAFIAGVGTSGTLTGCGGYLKEKYNSSIYALEPIQSSILTCGKSNGPHKIQGLSDDLIPKLYNPSLIKDIIRVDDIDSIVMAQKLCKELSLGVGISSGANFLGCVLSGEKNIVSVFSDDNKKYLSTELCDDTLKSELVDSIELIDFEVI